MSSQGELRLTESQRARLTELEKHSFHNYCKQMGYSPIEHESLLLRLAKEELDAECRTAAVLNPKAAARAREAVWDYLNAPDWWTFKRLQIRSDVMSYATDIAKWRYSLPINWRYLQELSTDLGIQPPRSDNEGSLVSFLLDIPHILLYGIDFNAFVGRESLIDNLPCICVYEQLKSAVESFLDVAAKQIFRCESKSFAVADPEEWASLGSEPGFVEACREALEMILCHKDYSAHDPKRLASRSWPEFQIPFMLLSSGAISFVCNHEYGHLLMGHLTRTPGHQLEFEADSFSWNLVASKYEENPVASFWYMIGGISALIIIALVELIQRQGESKSHPRAEERVYHLMKEIDHKVGASLFLHLQAILGVCQVTVRRHYAIHYEAVL